MVEVESESAEHLYTCRQIRLTNAKVVCHIINIDEMYVYLSVQL